MPLILILRFISSLASLALLAGAAYLLWRWYDGYFVEGPDGIARRIREDWPLWVGLGLIAWSFLGGLLLRPLLAGPNKRVLRPLPSDGPIIQSPTGSKLHVQMHGAADAPTIILTHGWSLDSSIWSYAVEDLTSRFRVITWDLPEMGRSKGHIDLASFAKDLEAVVRFAGDERAVLVGHSIGGMTIQTLARDNPFFVDQYVAGIVLLNTTYTNPLDTMILSALWRALRWPVLEPLMWLATPLQPFLWLSAWQSYLSGAAHVANRIGFGKHVSRSQLNVASLLATKNPPGAQARGCLAMFRWDATGALGNVSAPVLVIGGALDIVTKPEASQTLATGDGLTIVSDVNHMGFIERAEIYNDLIMRFADKVQRREPEIVNAAFGVAAPTRD
jgi:pimeloyl-ACP methyl ester carboxylesterase